MTDEARHYMEIGGREFESHYAVNHGEKEYVRYFNEVTDKARLDGKPLVVTHTITTNTVEWARSPSKSPPTRQKSPMLTSRASY
jgi:hypothetical protein